MKVLVTGGAGFIGSHLVDNLLKNGHRVVVIDDLSTGKRSNLPAEHPALRFVQGDIRDADLVADLCLGTDAVVHLAAVASVQASVEAPVATHAVNFMGTLNVLEAMRRSACKRIVFASSAAVYGDAEAPIVEQRLLSPLTPYAADKLAGEHYLRFYCHQHGISSFALRFFNVYGPRQDPSSPYSGVISIFVDRLARGLPVNIYGDGAQTRDFVYVGDVIDALQRCLNHPSADAMAMNLGTGVATSLIELCKELGAIFGIRPDIRYLPQRSGDIRHSTACVGEIAQVLDWRAMTSLATGLRSVVDSVSGAIR